jgi:hypothetical protein
MQPFESMEDFRAHTLEAGLGEMTDDELAHLKRFYDGAAAVAGQLEALVSLDDEPATTFQPGWIDPARR